jgi:hypothetical protein
MVNKFNGLCEWVRDVRCRDSPPGQKLTHLPRPRYPLKTLLIGNGVPVAGEQ